ncbi:MAG: phage protease [Victivallaceae bacterium]|nr:phage protease [Victivallaceae bacterium]
MEKNEKILSGLPAELAALESAPDAAAPDRVLLFAYGVTDYEAGGKRKKYQFDKADAVRLQRDFSAAGVDVPVDYNHQQLRAATNGQPAPAAGWITALEAEGDGLYARVKWTPKAEEMIRNREYRYTSPTFYLTSSGRVNKLYNLALTNLPATVGCRELVAAEQSFAGAGEPPGTTNKEMDMDDLETLLGLSKELAGEELDAACRAKLGELTALGRDAAALLDAVREPLALEAGAGLKELSGVVLTLVERAKEGDSLSSRVAMLEKDLDDNDKREAIKAGLAEGRICNAHLTALEKESCEGAKKIINANPAGTFPTAGKQVDRQTVKTGGGGMTALERSMAAALGLTDEEYIKSKAACGREDDND